MIDDDALTLGGKYPHPSKIKTITVIAQDKEYDDSEFWKSLSVLERVRILTSQIETEIKRAKNEIPPTR